MVEKVLAYRVENPVLKHGVWRDFSGNFKPVFDKLSHGLSRDLPMDDSDLYRQCGKNWFAAAPSIDTLKHWVSKQDVLELQQLGWNVVEFVVQNIKEVSQFEIIFTRDNIISQRNVEVSEIWN